MKYTRSSIEGRFLRGDPEAIGIVSRWIATVLTDLRFWGLSREWEDLHQDAMSGVVESLRRGRFDPQRDFRSYVLAVARYTIRHAVRQRRRSREEPLGPAVTGSMASGTEVEPGVLRPILLRQVLATIEPACRELIVAYYMEQRGYDEIAATLAVPVGTVKSRLFRCILGIQRAFGRAAVAPPAAPEPVPGTTRAPRAKGPRTLPVPRREPQP